MYIGNRLKEAIIYLSAAAVIGLGGASLVYKAFGEEAPKQNVLDKIRPELLGECQILGEGPVVSNGIPFYRKIYDCDGDIKQDKMGVHVVLGPRTYHENPISYWMDLDKDNKPSQHEILQDPKMDGLNGNETWMKPSLEDMI